MEFINEHIRQLENEEYTLCQRQQAIIEARRREDEEIAQYRKREDEKNATKRSQEDEAWEQRMRERDLEEDALRRRRRELVRSSVNHEIVADPLIAQPRTSVASSTPIRIQVETTRARKNASHNLPARKYGRATAEDAVGRPLFRRLSDGKMVFLKCCIGRCQKENFKTGYSLVKHVSHKDGVHKKKGLLFDNDHAIEVCGQEVPSRENQDGSTQIDNTASFEAEVSGHDRNRPQRPLSGPLRRRKRPASPLDDNSGENVLEPLMHEQNTPADRRNSHGPGHIATIGLEAASQVPMLSALPLALMTHLLDHQPQSTIRLSTEMPPSPPESVNTQQHDTEEAISLELFEQLSNYTAASVRPEMDDDDMIMSKLLRRLSHKVATI
ncbi:MAG: hypothetical protein Q9164_000142 [Protoblastenia rupestris]